MSMNIKFLYRYIIKRGDRYCIFHNGERLGTFTSLENAMLERDLLEWCDWDEESVLDLGSVPNPYEFLELPPFPVDRNSINRIPYVTVTKQGKFRVQKVIDGELVVFGTVGTRRQAEAIVDELRLNGWHLSDGRRQVRLV